MRTMFNSYTGPALLLSAFAVVTMINACAPSAKPTVTTVALAECATEDGSIGNGSTYPCQWDGRKHGNGTRHVLYYVTDWADCPDAGPDGTTWECVNVTEWLQGPGTHEGQ
jgi:hypothetical protein